MTLHNIRIVRNLIGPQVRRRRCAKNWSQEKLMEKLRDLGWDICRQRVARIESCEAWVSDFEFLLLARALGTELIDLLPKLDPKKPLHEALSEYLAGQIKTLKEPEQILLDRSALILLPKAG